MSELNQKLDTAMNSLDKLIGGVAKLKQQRDELLAALGKIYSIEVYQRKLIGLSDLSSPELPESEIEQIAKEAIANATE